MKSFFSFFIILSAAALLISCPDPLTEDDVMAAEDGLVPSISVISPEANDAYYSEVEFSLEVIDDAKSEGDGKGDLASIEFSVSNDDFRGGKINISGGSVTQDDSGGPDEILYDSDSGLCTFSFSTVDPNPLSGYISVTVKAVDRNGNETEEKVSLSESTGPWLDYTLLDQDDNENKYIATENVYLSGSLGNSSADKDSDDEIYSISWSLANFYSVELVLDKEASYTNPYDGVTTESYYDEGTGLYSCLVSNVIDDITYQVDFVYDPATRTFTADNIYMPDSLSGAVILEMVATDMNGHETESTVYISENTQGPFLLPSSVDSNNFYSHFSTDTGQYDPVTGTHDINESSDIHYFRYTLQYDGEETPVYSYPDASIDIDFVNNDFTINYYDKLSALGNYGTLSANDGEIVKIFIEAAFNADQTSSVLKNMVQDNTAPTITGFSFTGDQGGDAYANEGSTVEFSFTLSENLDLKDTDELSLDIDLGSGTLESGTAVSTGAMSFDYTGAEWNGLATSDTGIPFSITVEDRLGNAATYSETALTSPVTYYDGTESYTTFLTNTLSADDDSTLNAEDSWARQGEDVLLEISSGRDTHTPTSVVILVDGANSEDAASSSGSGDYNYTAAHTGSLTDGAITMAYSIVDMAGNSYSVSIGGITLDGLAPDLGAAEDVGLMLNVSGTGAVITASDLRYLTGNCDDDEQLEISGLGLALDTNYSGFRYKLFDTDFGTLETGTGTVSVDALDTGSGTSILDNADAEYAAVIEVTDIAGNTSEKSFPVFLDTTPPEITVTRFNSNNDTNTDYAREGDTIYLDFGITDTMIDTGSYVFSLYGEPLDSSSGSGSWSYTRALGAMDTDYNNSTIPLSITAADMVGNSTTVEDSDLTAGGDVESSITYYKGDLDGTLTMTFGGAVSYAGDQEHWSGEGDTISLTINQTTPRDIESDSILYGSNSLTTSDTGSLRTFSYTTTSSDSNGQVLLDIDLMDKAGNTLDDGSYSVDDSGYSLYYDKTPPTVTALSLSLDESSAGIPVGGGFVNSYYDDSEQLLVQGLDSDLDTNYYSFAYKVFETDFNTAAAVTGNASVDLMDESGGSFGNEDGTSHTATVRIYDKAGNYADKTLGFTVDITPPDFSGVSFTPSGTAYAAPNYYNAQIDSSSDNVLDISGISTTAGDYDTITYSFDDVTAGALSVSSGDASIDVDELDDDADGTYTAGIEAIDAAGNSSSASFDVILDTIDPATSGYTTGMSGDGGYTSNGDNYINNSASNDSSLDFSAVNADCASYRSDVNSAGYSSESDISSNAFSVDVSDLESESDGSYSVGIRFYDAAGNHTDITESVTVDTVSPTLASGSFSLAGDGFSGDYFNSGASNSGSYVDLSSFTSGITDYLGFTFNLDSGGYGDVVEGSAATAALTMAEAGNLIAPDTTASHTLRIRAVDHAGNESGSSSEYDFTVDTVPPVLDSVTRDVYPLTTVMTLDFDSSFVYSSLPSISPDPGGSQSWNDGTKKLTVTGAAFADDTTYTFTFSGVVDAAGNPGVYTVDNSVALAYGGVGNDFSDLTLENPSGSSSGSSGSKGSYKQRSGAMTGRLRITENPEEAVSLSSEMKVEALDEMKSLKRKSLTAAVETGPVHTAPPRIVERPDLNTGIEALSRAMEQVEKKRADYNAFLDTLTSVEMSTAQMLAMTAALEPEILEPRTVRVSASPLVSSAAGEIEVSLSHDSAEQSNSSALYLTVKALIVLMGVLLTVFFLYLMRRRQR